LGHASRSRSRKCLRHCSLVIAHCSADISMRSTTPSRPQQRTQTGASSNLHFTCFVFQYISLGFSIFQQSFYSRDSEERIKNNQGTTKEQKEQGKCSFRALISVVPNSFSSRFYAFTISLSQYITHLLIILTNLSFRALIRRPIASNKTLRFLCAKYKPQCFMPSASSLDHSS
jgi:hypothetical protein